MNKMEEAVSDFIIAVFKTLCSGLISLILTMLIIISLHNVFNINVFKATNSTFLVVLITIIAYSLIELIKLCIINYITHKNISKQMEK